MRSVALFLIAVILFTVTSTQAQTAEEKELRRIEAETARLEQQNDTALAKFLADDWVCVGARTLSKREFIENVKRNLDGHENGVNSYTIEKKQVQVHVFGDTAVVTLVKEYRQTPDTTKFFAEEDTDVFTREMLPAGTCVSQKSLRQAQARQVLVSRLTGHLPYHYPLLR
jgi:ketosteroid isomerase-like protein